MEAEKSVIEQLSDLLHFIYIMLVFKGEGQNKCLEFTLGCVVQQRSVFMVASWTLDKPCSPLGGMCLAQSQMHSVEAFT